jgi:hypothetical protein
VGGDPVEVGQRKLTITGFHLPVLAGGRSLALYPPQLVRQLGFELAALFELDVGLLQPAARRKATPPEDAEACGLLEGEAASGCPTSDYGVHRSLAQDAVASDPGLSRDSPHVLKPRPRAADPVLCLTSTRDTSRDRDLPVR